LLEQEPKENASAIAVQVWNKDREATRERTSLSRLVSEGTRESGSSPGVIVISSSSEARSDSGDSYRTDLECEIEQSDTESNASSAVFVHQDNLPEIFESLQT
jgi:hypothetical protein